MINFNQGDIVLVDLGYAAKVRPAVVVSIPKADSQRNMAVIVPLTTEIRGGECEVAFPKLPWLRSLCVVNLLGIGGIDSAKIQRRLAPFPSSHLPEIERGLARLLGLKQASFH